jgi:LPXTG-motif cell wall-anchored protein
VKHKQYLLKSLLHLQSLVSKLKQSGLIIAGGILIIGGIGYAFYRKQQKAKAEAEGGQSSIYKKVFKE